MKIFFVLLVLLLGVGGGIMVGLLVHLITDIPILYLGSAFLFGIWGTSLALKVLE